jgi:hypothetical protein
MKLMKLAFWRSNKEEAIEEQQENKLGGNVIEFPKNNEKDIKDIEDAFTGFYTWKYKGLLDLEEVQKFLDETYYKIGYNNGYNFQTEESLRSGKDQILFDFKNTLEKIYRQKLKHIDEIEIHLSKIGGAYESVTKMLDGICTKIKKEIEVIEDQISLSLQNKGWIEGAVNKYHRGFQNGLQQFSNHQFLPHTSKGE